MKSHVWGVAIAAIVVIVGIVAIVALKKRDHIA